MWNKLDTKPLHATILFICIGLSLIVFVTTALFYVYVDNLVEVGLRHDYKSISALINQTVADAFTNRDKQLVMDITNAKAERIFEITQKLETAVDLSTFTLDKPWAYENDTKRDLIEFSEFDKSPDLRNSLVQPDRYRVKVSMKYSDFILRDKSLKSQYNPLYWKLTTVFQRLYSIYPHILWIYAGFEKDGSFIGYPGTASEPLSYDPRRRDWYLSTKSKGTLNWVKPYYESSQNSLVVTVAAPIYSTPQRRFIGVVAIDLLLEELIYDVLEINNSYDIEYMVLDRNDMVMARRGYDYESGSWTKLAPQESLSDILKSRGVTELMLQDGEITEVVLQNGEGYIYSSRIKGNTGWRLVNTNALNNVT